MAAGRARPGIAAKNLPALRRGRHLTARAMAITPPCCATFPLRESRSDFCDRAARLQQPDRSMGETNVWFAVRARLPRPLGLRLGCAATGLEQSRISSLARDKPGTARRQRR